MMPPTQDLLNRLPEIAKQYWVTLCAPLPLIPKFDRL